MPYLQCTTNTSINKETKQAFLADAVTQLAGELGKPERIFMAGVTDGVTMIFGESPHDPCLHMEFAGLGSIDEHTTRLTEILCQLAEQHFSIPGSRVFVRFVSMERHMWGMDGGTFG